MLEAKTKTLIIWKVPHKDSKRLKSSQFRRNLAAKSQYIAWEQAVKLCLEQVKITLLQTTKIFTLGYNQRCKFEKEI